MNSNVYHITYSPKFETACLYFEGCNFRCLGCIRRKCNFDVHLPTHLQRTLEKTETTNLTRDEILDILSKPPHQCIGGGGKLKLKKLIFMGGEPTIDPNFVSLTKELKMELNVYNVLLTNAYNFVDLSWIDEVCVGIKAASPRLHKEYTGKDSKTVFGNLKKLNKEKISLRTESMFMPGYIDIKETKDIAYAISKINPNIPHRIDGYIPVPGTKWRRPNLTELKEAVKAAKRYLKEVNYMTGRGVSRPVILRSEATKDLMRSFSLTLCVKDRMSPREKIERKTPRGLNYIRLNKRKSSPVKILTPLEIPKL